MYYRRSEWSVRVCEVGAAVGERGGEVEVVECLTECVEIAWGEVKVEERVGSAWAESLCIAR